MRASKVAVRPYWLMDPLGFYVKLIDWKKTIFTVCTKWLHLPGETFSAISQWPSSTQTWETFSCHLETWLPSGNLPSMTSVFAWHTWDDLMTRHERPKGLSTCCCGNLRVGCQVGGRSLMQEILALLFFFLSQVALYWLNNSGCQKLENIWSNKCRYIMYTSL